MTHDVALVIGTIGFYGMLIVAVVAAGARMHKMIRRESTKASVLDAFSSTGSPPTFDILRVGSGVILTLPCEIDEGSAERVRVQCEEMLEDGVVKMIVELERGPAIGRPLVRLLTELADVSFLTHTHLSVVAADRDSAGWLRGFLTDGVPIISGSSGR